MHSAMIGCLLSLIGISEKRKKEVFKDSYETNSKETVNFYTVIGKQNIIAQLQHPINMKIKPNLASIRQIFNLNA